MLSGGGGDGEGELRASKNHGGTPLVLHPEDAAMPLMPQAFVAAGHPNACLPVPNIAPTTVAQFLELPAMVPIRQRGTQYRRIQQDAGQQLSHDRRLALHP